MIRRRRGATSWGETTQRARREKVAWENERASGRNPTRGRTPSIIQTNRLVGLGEQTHNGVECFVRDGSYLVIRPILDGMLDEQHGWVITQSIGLGLRRFHELRSGDANANDAA
jgi:hypothetical protein